MPVGHAEWHDHVSPDPSAALAFYAAVFGWRELHTDPTPGGPYTVFGRGEAEELGGMTFLGGPFAHLPPHWNHYFAVADVEAAAERVTAAGGEVCFGPVPVPNVGRFTMIRSPLGATAFLLEHAEQPAAGRPEPGQFCWMTLSTPDEAGSKAFWGAVLGWTFSEPELGGGFTPTTALAGEAMVADLDTRSHPEGAPAMWMGHVAVESLTAAIAKAEAAGGSVALAPVDLGSFGRMAILADPFGVLTPIFEAVGG